MNHAFDRPRLSRVSFDDAKPSAVCRRQVVVRSSSSGRRQVARGVYFTRPCFGSTRRRGGDGGAKAHAGVLEPPLRRPVGDQSGTSRGPVGDLTTHEARQKCARVRDSARRIRCRRDRGRRRRRGTSSRHVVEARRRRRVRPHRHRSSVASSARHVVVVVAEGGIERGVRGA